METKATYLVCYVTTGAEGPTTDVVYVDARGEAEAEAMVKDWCCDAARVIPATMALQVEKAAARRWYLERSEHADLKHAYA